MPPNYAKPAPKIYQILLRTHKLTIFFTLPPTTTIASLKEEALSALTSDVNQVEGVPKVTTTDDFELCQVAKGRDRAGEYEVLDTTKNIKDARLTNWEILYIQFRDSSGDLMPVTATDPPMDDEDDEQPQPPPSDSIEMATRKGKRKATEMA